MSLEDSSLTDVAVWWQVTGHDRYGEPIRVEGVEILVRWEYRARQMLTPDGQNIVVESSVTHRDPLKINDLLYHGTLADFSNGSGDQDSGVVVVQALGKIPDIKGIEYELRAGVNRFRTTMPNKV